MPALKEGRRLIQREDAPALYEIMHVVRDNLNNDLRDSSPHFFKNFPIDHLISHYPAIFPAPDGEYRIPAALHMKEPDLRAAALSRAAELSMVAFDSNSPESQVLQGWLMDDHFLMRGPFGISYEFLWANPYQPGLSYYHVPLIFRDETFGRLFIRSSWDEAASWLGVFEGEAQLFQDGHVTVLNPQISAGPVSADGSAGVLRQRHHEVQGEARRGRGGFHPGLEAEAEVRRGAGRSRDVRNHSGCRRHYPAHGSAQDGDWACACGLLRAPRFVI